jgi:hypothetical protein
MMTTPTYLSVTAIVLSLLTGVRGAPSQKPASSNDRQSNVNAKGGGHLSVQSTIGDILRHPAFAGFSRLLLPWDDRVYEEQMPLVRIASLLPYHSHVDPETVANGLNRMIDDAARGQTVFYRFYSETQMKQQTERANTGLFFFRGRPGAPFAVVSPGGGFSYVGSVHEGFPYAEAISRKGYNAFVLKYRAGRAARLLPRIWLLLFLSFFVMRKRWGSARATLCGAVRRAPGWRPRSARMERPITEATPLQSRRPS